jgi:two-component system nitrogen regulation sensor histidine kinase NtrY
VLTSVTAGVIGLNAEGRIDFMNRSAIRLLGLVDQRDSGLSCRPRCRNSGRFSNG